MIWIGCWCPSRGGREGRCNAHYQEDKARSTTRYQLPQDHFWCQQDHKKVSLSSLFSQFDLHRDSCTNMYGAGPTRLSSPSPLSQDTDQTSAPPPSPAHPPSANPNDQRRTLQRRSPVVQKPRRRLLRRKSEGSLMKGSFASRAQ